MGPVQAWPAFPYVFGIAALKLAAEATSLTSPPKKIKHKFKLCGSH